MEEFFRLDKETGRLFWKRAPKYHKDITGKEAGSEGSGKAGKRYWIIQLNGKKFRRSHVVYFLTHGAWPIPCLDHINGDSLDDRPSNLRVATITQNAWNHKHRKRRIPLPMGVRKCASGTFEARIGYKKTQIHLGSYETPEQAAAVYQQKRKELYGDFA